MNNWKVRGFIPVSARVVGVGLTALAALLCQPLSAQATMGMNPARVGADETSAIRITDGIWQATGFGNTFMVVTADGDVIIDTSLPSTGERHKQPLQAVSDAPVRYILLTHAHVDHSGGIPLWREEDTGIIAHAAHAEFRHYQRRLAGMFASRSIAQFPDILRGAPAADIALSADSGNAAALRSGLAALEELLSVLADSKESGWLRSAMNETRERLGQP